MSIVEQKINLEELGMTEEEALNMMTRARMDSLCGKIDDPAAEERVQSYLNEVIFHEAEN